MKVLITGANGFIGSHLSCYFQSQGYSVTGWDIAKSPNARQIEIVDMTDFSVVLKCLQELKPDMIVHCSGAADVGKSVLNPELDYISNVTITHNLMFAIHSLHLHHVRVVFLSSAAVYGNPDSLPIAESASLNPLSPYALHKMMCENIFEYFYRNDIADVKIVRIFSAYGEGLKKQIFWDMYKKVIQTGKLAMYGTGNESRDYIYIDDLVNAIYLVATKAPRNELIYNVANGEEITIRSVAELFAIATGVDLKNITFNGQEREGDPINWCADITKLARLGYQKKYDLAMGLECYVKWVGTVNELA